ncbi:DUF1403 family protein [Chelativorans sp.]|uniref:DUF1403 family protein n=1 Tax=Chelativorans sp. TaxID=2203393 RepID=UPI002810B3DA|nr:DUF1403 family protein [Chelativorans sp.]
MDAIRFPALTPAALLPSVPAWAAGTEAVTDEAQAAFIAGAALTCLDLIIRSQPAWAGAWRHRLALKCAAAAARIAGRREDEAALRDLWALRKPSGEVFQLGPGGGFLQAWRHLAATPPEIGAERLPDVAELLGIRWGADLAALTDRIATLAAEERGAPFAAAAIMAEIHALRSDAGPLGWWLADLLVARCLGWPRAVPLLAAQMHSSAFRAGAPRRQWIRPGAEGFARAVCLGLAQGAADACRLGAEMARRAERLAAVAPKLRARGAGDAVRMLLEDDSVSGSLKTAKLSRFAARRLFERLSAFGAVRELSGRPTFRIYGL